LSLEICNQLLAILVEATEEVAIHRGILAVPRTPNCHFDQHRPCRSGARATKSITFVVPMSRSPTRVFLVTSIMEPGPVEVSAGSSSSNIRSSAKLTVTEKTRVLKGQDRAFLSTATVA
jgi:hypothetical protein